MKVLHNSTWSPPHKELPATVLFINHGDMLSSLGLVIAEHPNRVFVEAIATDDYVQLVFVQKAWVK